LRKSDQVAPDAWEISNRVDDCQLEGVKYQDIAGQSNRTAVLPGQTCGAASGLRRRLQKSRDPIQFTKYRRHTWVIVRCFTGANMPVIECEEPDIIGQNLPNELVLFRAFISDYFTLSDAFNFERKGLEYQKLTRGNLAFSIL
jgi:hypothetical protein